jgi:hypothetical protein
MRSDFHYTVPRALRCAAVALGCAFFATACTTSEPTRLGSEYRQAQHTTPADADGDYPGWTHAFDWLGPFVQSGYHAQF